MAMKMLSTRLLANNLPLRVCVTSSASMSSSAQPASKPLVATKSAKSPAKIENPIKKRESLKSKLASIFGGYVDPADPNEGPLPASKVDFPDMVEQATGNLKLFLLAFENGHLDPYCTLPVEIKDRGTKENPVIVHSFLDERMIGCVCEPSQNHIKYMDVYKGEPKRCLCGYWIKLVDAPKFWRDIPKEDLLTIPFFMELEEEGVLDKLLAGEMDPDEEFLIMHGPDHH